MTAAKILRDKGSGVVTVGAEASLAEAARTLSEHRIGALVVVAATGEPIGIVSERDIVRAIAREGQEALARPASEIMTRELIVCGPDDSIYGMMNLMTNHRVRHLPVVVDGRLQGIISIGDVVKWRIAEIEFEASEMKRYIAG
jgi:CBS domain-containing protein